ncbi:FitA-like ribbon-helix-helix domain-containing protein [Corynebacterium variabile]|uniref:FitA-like ribbon-helix-helix domain-containing protein n=1 Tax=Corynebacterium variabile TaxID=1727 RepID=UPI0037364241
MTSIIVRGLDESVKADLAALAREHGRSMEAEARDILTRAVRRPNVGLALMKVAQGLGGFEEFTTPDRADRARAADFE